LQEVQGEVAKTLLDMLFFMQKLRYVTGSDSLLPSGSASHDVASREAPPDAAAVDAEEALRDNLDRFMLSNTASIELLWDNRLEKVRGAHLGHCLSLDFWPRVVRLAYFEGGTILQGTDHRMYCSAFLNYVYLFTFNSLPRSEPHLECCLHSVKGKPIK
jgi:hypothetical protein